MKRILITALMGVLTVSAFAKSTTFSLAGNSYSNLFSTIGGAATVSRISVTAGSVSNANIVVYDAPTNSFTYVVGAYTNYTQYGTNLVYSSTNYNGYVTSVTNFVLVTQSNSVAAVTNSYQAYYTLTSPTNTTTTYSGLGQYFRYGLLFTNSLPGTTVITVTYNN